MQNYGETKTEIVEHGHGVGSAVGGGMHGNVALFDVRNGRETTIVSPHS